jgi:hypothetical protein
MFAGQTVPVGVLTHDEGRPAASQRARRRACSSQLRTVLVTVTGTP